MMRDKIVILGAGESGNGSAILAKKYGYNVFVSDKAAIDVETKHHFDQLGIDWGSIEDRLGIDWASIWHRLVIVWASIGHR